MARDRSCHDPTCLSGKPAVIRTAAQANVAMSVCRLFGFRSVIPSQVHRSLVAADNAIGTQSVAHPDGWGVAHYIDGAPHLTRSCETALEDVLFHRVSGVVSSETVVAHVRKATVGAKTVLNCHPFQYGRWVFAHNGDIPKFERCRAELVAQINPHLRRFILGETDSEVVFFLLLSELSRYGPLGRRLGVQNVIEALGDTMKTIRLIADGPDAPSPALLTVLITNGTTMVAAQGGKQLFWSTYKTKCQDRDACSYFAPECEAESQSGYVNHMILSSEPLSGENVWIPMKPGEVVGVDWRMHLVRSQLDTPPSDVVQIGEAAL